MTPEDRAKKWLNDSLEPGTVAFEAFDKSMVDFIATAIREAVEAEREACAKIVMSEGYPAWDEDVPQSHRDTWEQCATRMWSVIRARGQT